MREIVGRCPARLHAVGCSPLAWLGACYNTVMGYAALVWPPCSGESHGSFTGVSEW